MQVRRIKRVIAIVFVLGVFGYVAFDANSDTSDTEVGLTTPAYAIRNSELASKLPIDGKIKESIEQDSSSTKTRYIGPEGEIVLVLR